MAQKFPPAWKILSCWPAMWLEEVKSDEAKNFPKLRRIVQIAAILAVIGLAVTPGNIWFGNIAAAIAMLLAYLYGGLVTMGFFLFGNNDDQCPTH